MNTNGTVNITNLPITYPFPDHHPLHVNAAAVSAWSTNVGTSLLDGTMTIPAGSLRSRNIFSVEAFGSFSDPGVNGPTVTFAFGVWAERRFRHANGSDPTGQLAFERAGERCEPRGSRRRRGRDGD